MFVDSMLICPAVTTCPNAMTALDRLRDRRQHFDLVLSDVYMPGKPGPCIAHPQAVPGGLAGAGHVHPLQHVSCQLLAMEFLLMVLVDRTSLQTCGSVSSSCVAADMDGFKLLEHIGLELDLPVISE